MGYNASNADGIQRFTVQTAAFIMLGTNDVNAGNSWSTVSSNLTAIVAHLKAQGVRNIVRISPPLNSGTPGASLTIADLIANEKTLASTLGVAHFAVTSLGGFESIATMQTAGFITNDGTHLTDAGEQAMGRGVIRFVTGTEPSIVSGIINGQVTLNLAGSYTTLPDLSVPFQVIGDMTLVSVTSNTPLTLTSNQSYGGSADVGLKLKTANGTGNWSMNSWEGVCGASCGAIGFFNNDTGQAPIIMDSQGDVILFANTTVGGLPTCDNNTNGAIRYVTDASSPSWNATLSGGGSTRVLAVCNGSNWTAH